ncbi:MAG TPA: acetylglutamate kinase, partial [Longimicrobium sp.]
MRGALVSVAVVKVGGNEVDDRAWVARLAAALAARPGNTTIVHGGGKEVTALQRALGSEPEWRDGLRVTTDEGMSAVSMVLSGVVNKRIVAALITAGVDAVGVSGEDGALVRADVARGGSMGRTGEVREVRASLLAAWMAQGLTPVLSSVSRGPDGGPLNVNADDAAAALAVGLGADRILFVTDVPGVLVQGGVASAIGANEAER